MPGEGKTFKYLPIPYMRHRGEVGFLTKQVAESEAMGMEKIIATVLGVM